MIDEWSNDQTFDIVDAMLSQKGNLSHLQQPSKWKFEFTRQDQILEFIF